MRVFENRASVVLYHFLRNNPVTRPFLLPANVCPIVPLIFLQARVDFEFVDIDITHAMNLDQCKRKLQKGIYGGILFVHAYGKIFDNTDFYDWVKKRDSSIYIIDDRCLCIPRLTEEVRKNVDLELYSTGYAKYVELSYGGWGIVSDRLKYLPIPLPYREEAYQSQMEHVRRSLKFGQYYDFSSSDWLDGSGINSSDRYLEEIRTRLEIIYQHKEKINAIYRENLPVTMQWEAEYCHWRFMITVDEQDKILKAIFSTDLFAGTNFPSVAYMFRGIHLPVAENEQRQIINLFNDFRVDEAFAYKICKIINRL